MRKDKLRDVYVILELRQRCIIVNAYQKKTVTNAKE